MALRSHPHHLFPVLGPAACCLLSVCLSVCLCPARSQVCSSFPRHLSKPLDLNPAAFLALSPAFSLLVMLDGKRRQMLYLGKAPGMTDKRQQWMLGAGWGGCEELVGCLVGGELQLSIICPAGVAVGELGGRNGSVCCAELSWGKAAEPEG